MNNIPSARSLSQSSFLSFPDTSPDVQEVWSLSRAENTKSDELLSNSQLRNTRRQRTLKTSQAQMMQEEIKEYPQRALQAIQRYRNARIALQANNSETEIRSTLASIKQESFDVDDSICTQLVLLQAEVRGLKHRMRTHQIEQKKLDSQDHLVKLELLECLEEKSKLENEGNVFQCECRLI